MPSQLFTYRTTITGHEHIYELGLINMNGRMYDPSGENGNEPQGNSSGNHGSPGGSVEVQSLGKGVFVENAIIDMNYNLGFHIFILIG